MSANASPDPWSLCADLHGLATAALAVAGTQSQPGLHSVLGCLVGKTAELLAFTDGMPEAETPIARMHREICRLRDRMNEDRTLDDDQLARICDDLFVLADAIVDMPASNLADMMLKFMGHTINGDHETGQCPGSGRLWAEARALIRA